MIRSAPREGAALLADDVDQLQRALGRDVVVGSAVDRAGAEPKDMLERSSTRAPA